MLNKEDVFQSGSRCLVGEKAQDRRWCKHLSQERARRWSIRFCGARPALEEVEDRWVKVPLSFPIIYALSVK
ncbi:MAG TPA: hypothetical protein VIE89_32795 [Candidatus Binatia bacterium]